MNKKLVTLLVAGVLLLSLFFTGCQGGVAQELYDKIVAQLGEAQSKITEAQKKASELEAAKETMEDELQEAKDAAADLRKQVDDLIGRYEPGGETKAEIAEWIVRDYHATHEYSTTDLFICSDMASEVWNILKAREIDAVIAIGDVHNPVVDIVQCNHAWVLAEVAPGEYLALETTGGTVKPRDSNPLYYKGWTFDSPADLKSHNRLVREYNLRVGIHNNLAAEDRDVIDDYNNATGPAQQDRLEAVHNKLVELIGDQQDILKNIQRQLEGLSTPL